MSISCDGEVVVRFRDVRGSGPQPRATQLSLFRVLPRPRQGTASRNQEGGIAGNSESETSGFLMMGRQQLGLQEDGRMAPTPKPQSQSLTLLSLPRTLHSLSLIHISEPTRPITTSRMPSSA